MPTRSAEKTLTVNCVLPTLRIASNGAPATVSCGDRQDYGFRAETQGGQPGGTFTYTWAVTNGWALPNPTAQVPGIRPSGNSGTTITLGGRYYRGTISAPLAPVTLVIPYSNHTAPPVITVPMATGQPPLFCYGSSFVASANGVGGAQFAWGGPAVVTFTPQVSGPGQLS